LRLYPILFAAGLMLGCSQSTVETSTPTPPPVDLSSGKVDLRLVGVWKNKDETYTLGKDGSFHAHWDRMDQTGPSKSTGLVHDVGDSKGQWSATPEFLFIASADKTGSGKHKLLYFLTNNDKQLETKPTYAKQRPGDVFKRVS